MPGGRGATRIRHNVFDKARYGVTGRRARPSVLVGHWPRQGPGSADVYEIHGNVFDENPSGEPLLQAEGRVGIYGNLFRNRHGDAVWIRPHHDRPRLVHVFWNTVVARGHGIRAAAPGAAVLIAGNVVLAGRASIGGAPHRDNVVDHYDRAADYLAQPFGEPVSLGPRGDRLRGPAIELPEVSGLSGWNEDVEGRRRDGTSRGAYHGPAERPWPVWGPATPPRASGGPPLGHPCTRPSSGPGP